jgi:signal peptide peptidase SppA
MVVVPDGGSLSIEAAREQGRVRLEAAVAQRRASASAIQVLPLLGDITQRGGFFGTSADLYGQAFSQAVADPNVGAIVLEVDSPGGEVHGIDELATRIRSARGSKPIVAVANTMAASASYWIAAQADELLVSPSGEVGSVGVYTVFEDWSKALDQAGVSLELIAAPDGKGLDVSKAMSDDLRAELRSRVDHYYGMFAQAVAKGRGVREAKVRDTWKAKMYRASEAVELGLADAVGTLDDAIVRASKLSRQRASTRAEVDVEVEARQRQRARA